MAKRPVALVIRSVAVDLRISNVVDVPKIVDDINPVERNRFAVKDGELSRLEVKAPVSASVPYL